MNGNPQIIDQLNQRLIEELTGINQYENNRSCFRLWGYKSLTKHIDERIDDEEGHYRKLLNRIRVLGGIPVTGKLNEVKTGQDVIAMMNNDLASENVAIIKYNEMIKLCYSLSDNGTRKILEDILSDEEDHARYIARQLIQIKQIGMQNYLSAKI